MWVNDITRRLAEEIYIRVISTPDANGNFMLLSKENKAEIAKICLFAAIDFSEAANAP